jgi:putative ABC transport system ATP-binding protein
MNKNKLSIFRRENIGMVFQDFNLLNSLTTKENILVPLILSKKYDSLDENYINKYIKMLNIENIMESYPYEISGGQKQRVAICRAIINNPKIIFADEPTGNLDSKSSENIMTHFKLLHKNFNANILMVTHDPISASYCDRIVFLQDGSIIKEIINNNNKSNFLENIMNILKSL